ncbi:PASTA domain-containing protein [Pseudonocardiaceae bacterium YIM PH 21723]|nr:PASTA domain-containing protein [Pseudonocardiaceae bacterium YIM PH 21723]
MLAGVLLAGIMFPFVGGVAVASNRASDTVNSLSSDLATTDPPLLTTIQDRDGQTIAYLYDQYRIPTPSDKISQAMKAALIAIEDRRFYEHKGVDFKGTMRAFFTNQVAGETSQGASTITQQYVKNYLVHVVNKGKLLEQQKATAPSPARKLREIRIALQLEQKLSKEEILTRYLNIVPFGNEVYGVGAAAHSYFNTTADKLTITQAALLAGMVNSPSSLDPIQHPQAATERRNLVIEEMYRAGMLAGSQDAAKKTADAAKSEPLGVQELHKPEGTCLGAGTQFGFFCQYVEDYLTKVGIPEEQLHSGGYTIRTTLDPKVSAAAKTATEQMVPRLTPGVANVMPVIVPGKQRHEVVALAANRDYGLNPEKGQTTYRMPDGISNQFGAGSTYKIFTSAAALEKGLGINNVIQTPGSYTSGVFRNGNGSGYTVKNASAAYPGSMTLQKALATSPNTGFVILEEKVGIENVLKMAQRLGMRDTMANNAAGRRPNPESEQGNLKVPQIEQFNNIFGGSFTLSPVATSPLELANVMATLMSGGKWCPPTPILSITDRDGKPISISEQPCEQAVSEGLANTLITGLSQDDQPGGTAAAAAKNANWTRPMAGKSGTTETHQSSAFVGGTPQYVASVETWADGRNPTGVCVGPPVRVCGGGDIYGGTVPAATWFSAMNAIHAGLPPSPLPPTDPRYVDGGSSVQVPDVVGLGENDAKAKLEGAGYKVKSAVQNNVQPRGTVVNQTPRGTALPGETITIYVSSGYVPPPAPGTSSEAPPAPPGTPPTGPPPGNGPPGREPNR